MRGVKTKEMKHENDLHRAKLVVDFSPESGEEMTHHARQVLVLIPRDHARGKKVFGIPRYMMMQTYKPQFLLLPMHIDNFLDTLRAFSLAFELPISREIIHETSLLYSSATDHFSPQQLHAMLRGPSPL